MRYEASQDQVRRKFSTSPSIDHSSIKMHRYSELLRTNHPANLGRRYFIFLASSWVGDPPKGPVPSWSETPFQALQNKAAQLVRLSGLVAYERNRLHNIPLSLTFHCPSSSKLSEMTRELLAAKLCSCSHRTYASQCPEADCSGSGRHLTRIGADWAGLGSVIVLRYARSEPPACVRSVGCDDRIVNLRNFTRVCWPFLGLYGRIVRALQHAADVQCRQMTNLAGSGTFRAEHLGSMTHQLVAIVAGIVIPDNKNVNTIRRKRKEVCILGSVCTVGALLCQAL